MPAMDLRVDGRVTVVTGAAQGIGRACAEALAAVGSGLAICDINAAKAETTAREIAGEYGVETRSYAFDVSDHVAGKAAVANIVADFGKIDHLVNNAGIQIIAPIAEFDENDWRRVLSIDLDAYFYMTKAVWPQLAARGGGRIVNLASVQGLIASKFKPAYISAKHGVVGLTKATAIEGAAIGITANAICPGAVRTTLITNQARGLAESFGGGISDEEALERAFLDQMPTRKFVEPEEVGALCAFLCSDAARSITGAPLPIDGGWFAT
jgi:3-hydroxybutyrate dehydrogenase